MSTENISLEAIGRVVGDGFDQPLAVFYPPKDSCRQCLGHFPPIQVVCIAVQDVDVGLLGVIAFYSRVVILA